MRLRCCGSGSPWGFGIRCKGPNLIKSLVWAFLWVAGSSLDVGRGKSCEREEVPRAEAVSRLLPHQQDIVPVCADRVGFY